MGRKTVLKKSQTLPFQSELKFDAKGLIPAVVQDVRTGTVLMMAYMNRVAVRKTLETGKAHYWSRSRKRLWLKGESSGNFQRVHAVFLDCDFDTLLLLVDQQGVACHTGRPSCFFYRMKQKKGNKKRFPFLPEDHMGPSGSVLEKIAMVIRDRKRRPKKDSYVGSLFRGGQDRVLKKVSEEAGELVIGSKNKDKDEIIHEMAGLWFHCLVVLGYHEISMSALWEELEGRFGRPGLKRRKRGKTP